MNTKITYARLMLMASILAAALVSSGCGGGGSSDRAVLPDRATAEPKPDGIKSPGGGNARQMSVQPPSE
ncbi:MAG: hypothetical protein R3E01_34075 [Pirellulaceae bacterium]|nr:hypothetical protein [Planctomycetales bacterium]